MMFTLRLLGGILLRGPSGPLSGRAVQRRQLALLALLACARERGVSRDKLVGYLWPEAEEDRARRHLSDSLYFLHKELGDDALIASGDMLRLNPKLIHCDVCDFEEALERNDLAAAVGLYEGPFLDGFYLGDAREFEGWVEEERARLRDRYASAVELLAERATEAGDPCTAAEWWKRLAVQDPYNSRAMVRLIEALASAGDPANALELARVHEIRLREELGIEPPAELAAAIERLHRERVTPAEPRAKPGEGTPSLAEPTPSVEPGVAAAREKARWRRGFLTRRNAGFAFFIALTVWAVVTIGRLLFEGDTPGCEVERKTIAVLPFENLSPDPDDAYVAAGLHGEVITQLAKVAALSVRGRTSVMRYASTSKSIKEIADELEVGTLVEGSVQVVGDGLRVNVQLIDATTDEHLWAHRYDGTLDDAFAIQSDVAREIVGAVGVALAASEQRRLAEVPTANAEAYRFYLQGRAYATRPGFRRRDLEAAQQLYERALALDAEFALAHAALSLVHGLTYWIRYDPSAPRAARQLEEAQAALRLAPELPEAHLAMAVARYYRGDYQRALDEFGIALEGLPNDAELWTWIGWDHRRLGHWSETVAAFEKAAELDPQDANLFCSLGGDTYRMMHRYAEAVRAYDRALSLAPDHHLAAVRKGWTYVLWQGQLDTLRAVLSHIPRHAELGDVGPRVAHDLRLLLYERRADRMLQLLATVRIGSFEGQDILLPASLYAAWAHQLRGDGAAARAAFDSARVLLDSELRELPDDWRVHAARGLALAGLGRRGEAMSEARWLQRSTIYTEDAAWGSLAREYRAQILAQAGDAEAALDEIEGLLAGPSWLSVHTLRLNPLWDPLRDRPRFQALLAGEQSSPTPKRP